MGEGPLLIAGGWALETSVLKWGADHIRHHAHCDHEADPYNAQRGFWYSHCGWLFFKDRYPSEKYAFSPEPGCYGDVATSVRCPNCPFRVGFAVYGRNSLQRVDRRTRLLLAGGGRSYVVVLNSTFCINSICHLWGIRPHSESDSSRDSGWISLLTFGEGYYNYHLTYQSDYRNGPHWYSFDPSKWLIFLLPTVGLATSLRRATRRLVEGVLRISV